MKFTSVRIDRAQDNEGTESFTSRITFEFRTCDRTFSSGQEFFHTFDSILKSNRLDQHGIDTIHAELLEKNSFEFPVKLLDLTMTQAESLGWKRN